MCRVTLVGTPADERVLKVFSDIRNELGRVPNIFRAYANHPELLELNWQKFKGLFLSGHLSRSFKESIALMVSADNLCDYGIYHHSSALEELGVEPKEVLRIRTNPDHAHFPPKEHALLELARHANGAPHDHGEKLVKAARDAGSNDAEIVEAIAVAGQVIGMNHFADLLAVPVG